MSIATVPGRRGEPARRAIRAWARVVEAALGAALALSVAVAAAPAARAQDGAGAGANGAAASADAALTVARTMDDRLFFVENLQRGWEPLVADFPLVLEGLGASDRTPVLTVRDRAFDAYARLREADRTEEGERRAFELYGILANEAVDVARRPEFARRQATIEMNWSDAAEKGGDDRKALDLALSAAKRSAGFERAYAKISSLGLKEAQRAEAAYDLDGALGLAATAMERLPAGTPSRGPIEEYRRRIESTTGVVAVQWLGSAEDFARVKGPRTDFTSPTFDFTPAGGERKPPPQTLEKPIRLFHGRYSVVARGAGSATFPAGTVEVRDSEASFAVPVAIPDNMVFVPATGGEDAFLIDRTEVTVEEFARPGLGNPPNGEPQRGVNWRAAQDYCAKSGKHLPTLRQWTLAAFGDPAPPEGRKHWFPAQQVQPGVHFVGGVDAPARVGSLGERSRSALGCLDMAGNVAEWLADESFIGGSFALADIVYTVNPKDDSSGAPRDANLLREPIPSFEKWSRLPDARERDRLYYYHAAEDGSSYARVGLRCVVPLGKPRSKP